MRWPTGSGAMGDSRQLKPGLPDPGLDAVAQVRTPPVLVLDEFRIPD